MTKRIARKNKGFFGGFFDFNGDGKTDLGEQYIAYRIFEECTKDNNACDRLSSDEFDFDPNLTEDCCNEDLNEDIVEQLKYKCDDLIAAVEQFQDRHDGIQEAVNVLANDVHLIKSKEDSDAWFKRSEELSALIAELEEEASKLEKQQEDLDEFREQLLL